MNVGSAELLQSHVALRQAMRLKGVIDGGEDAETNALRDCDASDDRECLTQPEWRTKWRSERRTKWWAERRANCGVVDSDSRWHAD